VVIDIVAALAIGIVSLGAVIGVASAAPQSDPWSVQRADEAPRDLRRPIDQGLADRNTLGTSLRSLPQAIDEGRSFGRLYVDPQRSDRFLRRQGGLAAVFPQSVYIGEGANGIAVVPPGTIFELGWNREAVPGIGSVGTRPKTPPKELVPPGENRLESSGFLIAPTRWTPDGEPAVAADVPDRGVAGFGDPLEAFEAGREGSGRPSSRNRPRFVRDAAYRHQRLDELFRRAVAASRAGD